MLRKAQVMQNENSGTASLQEDIKQLEEKLSGDMFKDLEIRDKIHNLKMKLNGTRPMDSSIDCVGCGG
jgi:hypothetical protein